MFRVVLLCIAIAPFSWPHGFPTPIPIGPLHVQGSILLDSTGQYIPLRGVQIPGLNLSSSPATAPSLDAVTFGTLRLRWNHNAVRLPVSSALWKLNGQAYLDRIAAAVKAANANGLLAVLANFEDASGFPTADTVAFWKASAASFKDNPALIFDVFNEPATRTPGQRSAIEWSYWLNGGAGSVGMQALVDSIRSAGAQQCIAVSAFNDALDFQGFTPDFYIHDPNVIYEVHPFFDHALTDDDRDRNFGFLARTMPVYAGAWGLDLNHNSAGCNAVPADPIKAQDILFQALAYFDARAISWTAASFETGSLLRSATTYAPTMLDSSWTCGVLSDPEPGMGQVLLLWLTGDPLGFGTLAADQIASAAGGPAGPLVPGDLVTIFGFLFGPSIDTSAALDATGNLPSALAGIQVFIEGTPVPLFTVGPYEITIQVPYSIAGKTQAAMQIYYQQVPSNTLILPVVPVAPRIVTSPGTTDAQALNLDGHRNSQQNPVTPGSFLSLFACGFGQTDPASVTGQVNALTPLGRPILPVTVSIGGTTVDSTAFAAPGLVGVLQVNIAIPGTATGKPHQVPVLLKVADATSLAGTNIWVN